VEYDGHGYVGWQRQKTGSSIQQSIEEAIHKFSGERVRVFGAGRTDAGVHALRQAAHFDLNRDTSADTVRDALNAHLRAQSISILSAQLVSSNFHARFSATERSYIYKILNRHSPPAIGAGRVWHLKKLLDTEAMDKAAQVLVGEHDFTTFRATMCQAKSPIKTLTALSVVRANDLVTISARAPSFLHHQIRNFVGTLRLVGEGKWTDIDVKNALLSQDRSKGGETAPSSGLFLADVIYPPEICGVA